MSERQIREAFTYGAGELQPQAELWASVEQEIARREAQQVRSLRLRRIWQRVAVAAAALVLASGILLGTSEQARAVVERWMVVWSGMVAGNPATVEKVDPAGTIRVLEAKELKEAEEATGLSAPVIELKGFTLEKISYAPSSGESRLRVITLEYKHESGNYHLSRFGYFPEGKHKPYEKLASMWSFEANELEQHTVGDALCVIGRNEADGLEIFRCDRLIDGFQVWADGPDMKVLESLVQAVKP